MNTQAPPPEDQPDDPLHVQLATALLVGALDTRLPGFALRREQSRLSVEMPDGSATEFGRFIDKAHPFDIDLVDPLPCQLVLTRLLEMAGIQEDNLTTGQIRLRLNCREPVQEATFRVVPEGENHLRFEVLDRQEIKPPARERPRTPIGEPVAPAGRR